MKIRIPVVVAIDGTYSVDSWSEHEMEHALWRASNNAKHLHNGKATHIVWIEADVPLPDPVTVEGRVVS